MGKILKGGLLTHNAIMVQYLGLCSAMAVTTSLLNGIGMGLAVMAVLIFSNVVVSLLRKVIPHKIRIAVCVVIIAFFVTAADMLMEAYFPGLSKSLGVFVPLIVANCFILGRAETFALNNSVPVSAFDGFAQGLGYMIVLVIVSVIREFLGGGTFGHGLLGINGSGIRVIPDGYPAAQFLLPFGGFFTLGILVALMQWFMNRRAAKLAGKSEAVK